MRTIAASMLALTLSTGAVMADEKTWMLVTKSQGGTVSIQTRMSEVECRAARDVVIVLMPRNGSSISVGPGMILEYDAYCIDAASNNSLTLKGRDQWQWTR